MSQLSKARIIRNEREFTYPVRSGLSDNLYLEHAYLVFSDVEYEYMTDIDEGLLNHFEQRDFDLLQEGDIFSISDSNGTREYFFLGDDNADKWLLKRNYSGQIDLQVETN